MSDAGLLRAAANPILTRRDIPPLTPDLADVSAVFNPGAIRLGDETLLLLRVQNRGRETSFMIARSTDGERFTVDRERVRIIGLEQVSTPIYHVYDARLTQIDGVLYAMVAIDMEDGCKLGLLKSRTPHEYEFVGLVSADDNRNGVLFPERIDGKYLRLDRPNRVQLAGGPVSGNAIWLSESADLAGWKPVTSLIAGRFHYWDELVGAGPPPIRTRHGWLCIYHGVATHFASSNIYQAGVFVLDLADPTQVVARSRCNILEPRESYELTGQVPNVVFPSGAVVPGAQDGVAEVDDLVFVYYGAADTVVGLATATVGSLLRAAGLAL
ncbi:glycoside hydrolase family 130 protein [candidate division KSB1 bacterium]|nr:glycoside hydrolase family 130 protein [candidate division KSB1 bacterium]